VSVESLKKLYDARKETSLEEYFTFLKFPSISSEPEFKPHMEACVQWLTSYLQELGFSTELWTTSGHPTLYAYNLQAGPEKPTLLIYNHYDVQPVDPLEAWESPPFEPAIRNGQVFARGAQDNKGQCFYVLQALRLLRQRDGKLPINIKLCIEGEEECGSAGLNEILESKKEQLKADYLAVVDLAIPSIKTPAVTLGIRGIVAMDVEATGSTTDLHSGCHGGLAYNPIKGLVEVLAKLYEPSGRVAIPGFYDNILSISEEDKRQLSQAFDEGKYHEMFGIHPTGGEQGLSPLERNWLQPTLEINGITGGYSGAGFKTVIPAKASAKVSCRLVPGQDPDDIGEKVAAFVERLAPPGITIKARVNHGGGKAVRSTAEGRAVKAFAGAFSEVFNAPCQYILEGASIPVVTNLAKSCGGEVVLLGLALPDDQIHAPNEHFGIDRVEKGCLIIARAIELLGEETAH
jgi:acetylornithine deacetylase/succinyl-diaminopimelate desuccinylase-like protein